jgi:putative ABC transport system permease protein
MNFEWWNIVRLRMKGLLNRRRLERDLEEELRFHLATRADRYRQNGIEAGDAARDARLDLGNPTVWKERCRDMWTFYWLETLGQDLRYAARSLRKSPGFTVVAALTLALGIGSTTAIFSVVNAVILRPLPYPQPTRLVVLWGNVKRAKVERRGASFPDYSDWRNQSRSFDAMAWFDSGRFTLTGVDEPERVAGEYVAHPYFSMLGVNAALGRTFRPEEDQVAQRDRVVVLSDGLWKRRFGGDPGILGRSIEVDGRSFTVVGVMPSWFRGVSDTAELWAPVHMEGTAADLAERSARGPTVLGRLKADVPLAQAQAEMDGICKGLEADYPKTNKARGVELSPLDRELFGPDVRLSLVVLLVAVGFVLLIACTNVANLLLARSEARQREIAVRIALGAGRGRVLHQLTTESLLLAVVGAGAGLLLARWGVRALLAASPITFPSYIHAGLDAKVALFTVLITCCVGLALGLAPAVHVRAGNLGDAFKQASSHAADSRSGSRFRSLLVVAEVAFAMLLLVGAGLLMRSLQQLAAIHPGYNPDHLLTLRVSLPRLAPPPPPGAAAVASDAKTVVMARDILRRVAEIPAVESVSLGSDSPLAGSNAMFYTAEGQPDDSAQTAPRAYIHSVTPGFFKTLGIRLIAGRTFTDRETRNDNVAIVSQNVVKRFWAGQDPIGKRIKSGGPNSTDPWMTIIGVVNEMKYRGLPENPTADPDVFVPLSERSRIFSLLVQTPLDPASLTPSVRAVLRETDRTIIMFNVSTMQQFIATETARSRFTGWLMAIFAGCALLLAMIGIYGVMSYSVSLRTQEIGIRVALGAERRDVLRLVVGRGMGLIAIGLALGVTAAMALTRLIGTLLYGVRPTDLASFAAAAVTLVSVALAACLLPASRASRIAPAVALRNE